MFVYTVSSTLGIQKQTNYGLPHIVMTLTMVNDVGFPGKQRHTQLCLSHISENRHTKLKTHTYNVKYWYIHAIIITLHLTRWFIIVPPYIYGKPLSVTW